MTEIGNYRGFPGSSIRGGLGSRGRWVKVCGRTSHVVSDGETLLVRIVEIVGRAALVEYRDPEPRE